MADTAELHPLCQVCGKLRDWNQRLVHRYAGGRYSYAHDSCVIHVDRALRCTVNRNGRLCGLPARRGALGQPCIGVCDECFSEMSRTSDPHWLDYHYPKTTFNRPYKPTWYEILMRSD